MNPEFRKTLEKQHYRIVGEHSGVKLCHWLKETLIRGRTCYKNTFYGIDSHRCLQMTPTIDQCTQSCLFCWRVQGFTETYLRSVDDPEFILEESIKAQRVLLTGFKGDPRVKREMWEEAQEPKHVAISLTGEPTLYQRLGEFIEAAHKRGMSTFVVTNGTTPKVLENLDPLPTQLYVTVASPNEEIYRKLEVPLVPNGWENIMKTLELLPSLDTRKVIRHTLVKDWNLGWIDDYAKLDNIASPNFIEPKGYVFVGASRERMTLANMPSHDEIREFAAALGQKIGYRILRERRDSRVLVMGHDEKELKLEF